MGVDEDKPIDLDQQLQTCVQLYEEARERYWKSRPEGGDWGINGLFGYASSVAEKLLCNVDDLVDHQPLAEDRKQFSEDQVGFLAAMAEQGRQL